ncbi:MAG: hypothetical protein M3419_03410, partial [Actinomycetota bacterium]|nr:hypothetical protein [Actinomycetota bacterium]
MGPMRHERKEAPAGEAGAETVAGQATGSLSILPPATGIGEQSTPVSPLRRVLEEAMRGHDLTMADLTVLEKTADPFRVDTPSRHRDGAWLADTARELGLGDRQIHPRGLHYMMIGRPKPDGTPYT